jgi:hypothetical protein
MKEAEAALGIAPTPHYLYFRTNWKLISTELQQRHYPHYTSVLTLSLALPHHTQQLEQAITHLITTGFSPPATQSFLSLYRECLAEMFNVTNPKEAKEIPALQ